ncbi:phosphoenolpyruvate carboxylase gene [Tanacetum coccineum]|uniref:Phosphoenolpyruvate carboxylase protein n=1 Tax=Tanacetum coccineum TaxID=301880 RepID=A0ABQ5HD91_9ASTR
MILQTIILPKLHGEQVDVSEETVSDFAGLKVYLLCVLIGGCFRGDLEPLCGIEGVIVMHSDVRGLWISIYVGFKSFSILAKCLVDISQFRIRDCLALHRELSSWMGDNRDGNLRTTPEVTRDVCLLARTMATNTYFSQIKDLMFEMSMWRCTDGIRLRAEELYRSTRSNLSPPWRNKQHNTFAAPTRAFFVPAIVVYVPALFSSVGKNCLRRQKSKTSEVESKRTRRELNVMEKELSALLAGIQHENHMERHASVPRLEINMGDDITMLAASKGD